MATFTERVLILCKTYPSPSAKYAETSCVAGVSETGRLLRLFPVPFRLVADDQQFRKWQWVTVRLEKAREDHRPESHHIFVDTIECDGPALPAGRQGWPVRMELLAKLPVYRSIDEAEAARQKTNATLALLRPKRISRLEVKNSKEPDWTEEERRKLLQMQQQNSLFDETENRRQVKLLEKIPHDFYYHYEGEADGVPMEGRVKLVDWEVCALYRNLRRSHGDKWEAPFREKLEAKLPSLDLTILLGTMHRWQDKWLGVSLIYPPRPQPEDSSQPGLF
jgi:hypothetical protein